MHEAVARYPRPRSAIMPLLHLVQAEEGYVSQAGIALVADVLGLTAAQVTAVATFYSMYRRKPGGRYHVGVCTNTLCAVMGGDEIFDRLRDHLGVPNKGTTADGEITLERIECNAACDYAPVMAVNWEFYDNQTPDSAVDLVEAIRAGDPPPPTRGPDRLTTFAEVSRVLAGFDDDLAHSGPSAGPASLAGLHVAQQLDAAGTDPSLTDAPEERA
jgi:NADH-quinone oxidoreductase subunit E